MRRKEIQQARFGLGGLICHPCLSWFVSLVLLLLSGARAWCSWSNSWLLYECKGTLAARLVGRHVAAYVEMPPSRSVVVDTACSR